MILSARGAFAESVAYVPLTLRTCVVNSNEGKRFRFKTLKLQHSLQLLLLYRFLQGHIKKEDFYELFYQDV